MRLDRDETELKGTWKLDGANLEADEVCNRIDKLTTSYLVKISSDNSGWNILFQDPIDNRFWELSYPESELHGGGPPRLKNLSLEKAKFKYQL